MNERHYDNQHLREYLLGSLPEMEAERFDELSFTDEEFANSLTAAENNLIDAYIHDELTGETLEKFKSHYLASPLRREKVNFAKTFQDFAGRNSTDTAKETLAAAASKPNRGLAGFFSALNIFAAPNPLRWTFAVAGLILILASGFWMLTGSLSRRENELQATREVPAQNPPSAAALPSENQNLKIEKEIAGVNNVNTPPPPTPKKEQSIKPPTKEMPRQQQQFALKPIVAFFILVPPVRGGAGQIQNLSVSGQTDEIAIRLELESADLPFYRVALADSSGGKNLWTSGKLKVKSIGENKSLNIRFPARLLKSQIYTLSVSGINSNGEAEIIGDYPFRAVIR